MMWFVEVQEKIQPLQVFALTLQNVHQKSYAHEYIYVVGFPFSLEVPIIWFINANSCTCSLVSTSPLA